MFESIEKMNLIFSKYDDGYIASIIECDRNLLTKLVLTATSNNFWLSKYAMNILNTGIDNDITYLELLTSDDWFALLNGIYSSKFTYNNVEYLYGWLLDFINIDLYSNNYLLLKYLETYYNNRQAIIACERYIDRIATVIPNFNISIWKYLVQFNSGQKLAIHSLKHYSIQNQKKIRLYLNKYS